MTAPSAAVTDFAVRLHKTKLSCQGDLTTYHPLKICPTDLASPAGQPLTLGTDPVEDCDSSTFSGIVVLFSLR